jgi:hypothetical protein
MLLKEHLDVQKSPQVEPVRRVLRVIASRLEHLETFNGELTKGLNDVKGDAHATDDEKFTLAKQLLQRYSDEIAQIRITAPDYKPFFRERVGEACWNWIGVDVQRVFNTAEDLYRYQEAKPQRAPAGPADFTPAVLEICRGFEELLNDKLGAYCTNIQVTVNRDRACRNAALREFPEKTLKGVLKSESSMSMWKIGTIFRVGRLAHAARPSVFDPKLGTLLAFSPGPADIEQLVFLNYIAAELRNGKVHSSEYTSAQGMRLVRKLVLGIDEGQVGYGSIVGWIKKSRFRKDVEVHKKKLSAIWAEFPGVAPSLWKALGATEAVRAA